MFRIKDLHLLLCQQDLDQCPEGKIMINTINAYSYNIALKDSVFAEALLSSDLLIPDGMSIVKACRFLNAKTQPIERCAGWDLFIYEMTKLNAKGGKCFFMGSNNSVLTLIKKKAKIQFPNISIESFSPPFKSTFTEEDNQKMINSINRSNPDLLWIGMTAPKQEKWVYTHWADLKIHCPCGAIGAVFDFYAGTIERAPLWWQKHGLEWLFRLIKEPRRMWRRYILGNTIFVWNVLKEYFSNE